MITIDRRRTMGKPYDSEVEYIKSTGTQYIDTGINLKNIVSMSAEISISKTITKNSIVFGALYNSSIPKFQIYITSQCKWSTNNATYYDITGVTKGGTVNLNTRYTPVVTSNVPQNSDVTILIFARNSDGNMLPIDGMCLYASQIVSDNVLVRDYIPVRVGQIGYLYDKITGKLFGNIGTDNFIIGNDVIT